MADTETSRAVAIDMLACMNEQDNERLWNEFLTEDSTWTLIAKGTEPMRGRAIPDFFAGGGSIFEAGAPTIEVTGVTAEGDRVAIEATGRGRLRNGRDYDNSYHFLMIVRDGRVLSVREYMDSQHVADVFAGLS
jgi:ketosteroid isomerase-like protein